MRLMHFKQAAGPLKSSPELRFLYPHLCVFGKLPTIPESLFTSSFFFLITPTQVPGCSQ